MGHLTGGISLRSLKTTLGKYGTAVGWEWQWEDVEMSSKPVDLLGFKSAKILSHSRPVHFGIGLGFFMGE